MNLRRSFSIGLFVVASCSAPMFADQLVNTSSPVSMVATNLCNGQNIALQGATHLTWNLSTNNNSTHVQIHINSQGVSGVGMTDGAKYILVNGTNIDTKMTGALPFDMRTNVDFALIGNGEAANSRIRMITHITVDAGGNVSLEFEKSTVVCQ